MSEKIQSSFNGYQLIGVFRSYDNKTISHEQSTHFWEDIVVLAEQHGFIINGGVRGLDHLREINSRIYCGGHLSDPLEN